MNLLFWKASKPLMVTKAITSYLTSEFGLGSELLAKLRMLEKNGKFSNRRVRMCCCPAITSPQLKSEYVTRVSRRRLVMRPVLPPWHIPWR